MKVIFTISSDALAAIKLLVQKFEIWDLLLGY